jgi:hypothetical protein
MTAETNLNTYKGKESSQEVGLKETEGKDVRLEIKHIENQMWTNIQPIASSKV